MALKHILVVHDSPTVRETVAILLAGDYEVHGMTVGQYLTGPGLAPTPDLLITDTRANARPLPTGAAVLWIENGDGYPPAGPRLHPHFSPRDLRRGVVAALARGPQETQPRAARLQEPFVSVAVAALLNEAGSSDLPLHLVGEPGVGKRAIARALHGLRARGQFLTVEADEIGDVPLPLPPDSGTLFVTRVDALPPSAQNRLLAALGPTGRLTADDGGAVRLVTAATSDLGDALDAGRFSPELYYRLTLLRADLPPLRERRSDIPALAGRLLVDLATALGRPAATLTACALERLSNYLWFGNVSELEAVLVRTLALSRESTIDAADLAFDGFRLPGRRVGHTVGAGAPARVGAAQLDLIINELAHEFKNPLVTLKTFAHYLRRDASNGDDAAQAARLTGEAVQQIDQTLENLLEFTKLPEPAPQTHPLAQLLAPVLAEAAIALGERGVRLDHDVAPAVSVRVDPQQFAYAFGNLLRALGRDLARGNALHLGFREPATVSVRLPAGADPLGNHLAVLMGRTADTAATPPLGVAIAAAVLDRNGAELTVDAASPGTVLVRLPTAAPPTLQTGITGATNGSAARTHR